MVLFLTAVTNVKVMIYLHGLSYSLEFSVVFLTFILTFDILYQFLEGNLSFNSLNYMLTKSSSTTVYERSERSGFTSFRVNLMLSLFI